MNKYYELKPFLGKVVECKIVNINESSIYAAFKDMPVRCSTSRTPKPIRERFEIGSKIPIYMAKVDTNHIEGNLYSKQIPEQLLKSRMNYVYIRCVFRKAGEFSRIISNRRINKSTIKDIERLLHERIYLTVLTYKQLQEIKTGKLPLKRFARGRVKP